MAMSDDIQKIFDVLTEVQVDVGVVKANVNSLLHSVDGNGKPGLKDRTTVLEQSIIAIAQAQRDCPAREAMTGAAKRQTCSNVLSLGSLAIALLAVLVVWRGARRARCPSSRAASSAARA